MNCLKTPSLSTTVGKRKGMIVAWEKMAWRTRLKAVRISGAGWSAMGERKLEKKQRRAATSIQRTGSPSTPGGGTPNWLCCSTIQYQER